MKYLHLLLFVLSFHASFFGQTNTAQVGTGSSDLPFVPAYGLYDYSQSGMIYLASELSAAGLTLGSEITELSFEFSGWSTGYTLNNQVIKMSHASASSFPNPGFPDYRTMGLRDTKIVKSNFTWTCPSNEDWELFPLTSSFIWDGSSNIVISWENFDGDWTSGYGKLEGDFVNNRSHSWFKDNSYPTASSSWDGYRPNIKFGYIGFNPLPITLIDFTASFVEDSENHVEINWKTVSEQNNDFFSIWRSLNGSDWETIKSVDGAENSSQLIAYQFIDRNLKVSDIMNNTLYYKLSQTDFDGSTEFFHIVSVYYKIPKTHIVKKTNLLGQDVGTNYKGIVIESWNNGETSKSYQP
jgi:hypothetical protein